MKLKELKEALRRAENEKEVKKSAAWAKDFKAPEEFSEMVKLAKQKRAK
jgi:hypothetical protein